MENTVVLAFHVIVSAYGFWLPNDPRGSWSDFVASWELLKFGKATKVPTRASVAGRPHDRAARLLAKKSLKYPPVRFSGLHARAIATGFARACAEGGFTIHACSILWDHAHFVLAWTTKDVTRVVGHMKKRATMELETEGLRPGSPVWAEKCWKVFLFSGEDVRRAIDYVNRNPIKHGLKQQRWKFVKPYVGERFGRAAGAAAAKCAAP